jgi:hypothetical protein
VLDFSHRSDQMHHHKRIQRCGGGARFDLRQGGQAAGVVPGTTPVDPLPTVSVHRNAEHAAHIELPKSTPEQHFRP